MMTQSYYGGDFDSFTRANHRASTAAHYDRSLPYTQYSHGYYDPPHSDLRTEYASRAGSRALINEHGTEMPPGHARRRIQVAVSVLLAT